MVAPAEALAAYPTTSSEWTPRRCCAQASRPSTRYVSPSRGRRPGRRSSASAASGHLGIQFAAKIGSAAVAIARGKDKEPLAKELGADEYIDEAPTSPAKLYKLGGAKVVLATVTASDARPPKCSGGLKVARRAIVVGASTNRCEAPAFALISSTARSQGHASGTSKDSQDTLRLSALKGVRPRIETMPLAEGEAAYDKMMTGAARFRMVLTMDYK